MLWNKGCCQQWWCFFSWLIMVTANHCNADCFFTASRNHVKPLRYRLIIEPHTATHKNLDVHLFLPICNATNGVTNVTPLVNNNFKKDKRKKKRETLGRDMYSFILKICKQGQFFVKITVFEFHSYKRYFLMPWFYIMTITCKRGVFQYRKYNTILLNKRDGKKTYTTDSRYNYKKYK